MAKRKTSAKPAPADSESPENPKSPFGKFVPSMGQVTLVRSKDAAEELKRFGTGWDMETESLLRLPDELFRMDSGQALSFSKGEPGGLSSALAAMERGSMPASLPEYCITVYETASSVFFVLCDMARRIFVREKIECIHDPVPQRDWSAVRERIKAAERAAAATKDKDTVALSDGPTRLVKLGGDKP